MSDVDWSQAVQDPLAKRTDRPMSRRVAIVAGGGLAGPLGGVGFAIAWLLAHDGASVAVLSRNQEANDRAVELIERHGGVAVGHTLDMTDSAAVKEAVDAVVARFGRLDYVADSIGGGGLTSVFEVSEEEWATSFDLNLRQVWHLIKHSQRHLGPGGAIVTISSTGVETRSPAFPYGMSKTALENMTIGVAGELAPRGVRANCVRVGMIWGAFAARRMDEDRREVRRGAIAMPTEGNSWDAAAAAHFLLSDGARWITAQTIAVDGGGAPQQNAGQASVPPVK